MCSIIFVQLYTIFVTLKNEPPNSQKLPAWILIRIGGHGIHEKLEIILL
jgi:hypothetical protein